MTTLLILGGTTEAAALAWALDGCHGHRVITSLAGRTRRPEKLPGETLAGGFGGADGLIRYLRAEAIDILIDATHPFARTMSRHASAAAERLAIPRLRLTRPRWSKQPGDHWIEVADTTSAANELPGLAGRIFLTSGHRDLGAFAPLDDIWFLIRTIEPVTGPLPRRSLCLTARGPFDEAEETALMRQHRIEALVTKASGGGATYAKIATARKLGLPVVMIRRPDPPSGPIVHDTDDALAWLRQVTG